MDKLRFALWAAGSLRPVRATLDRPDRTLAADLDAYGITGPLRSGVIEPFLAGVLAEREGSTSANFARLLIRSFVLGSPSVPSLGMGRFPELMAASLPPGTIRLNSPVERVAARAVFTEAGEIAGGRRCGRDRPGFGGSADRASAYPDEGPDHFLARQCRTPEPGRVAARRRRPAGAGDQHRRADRGCPDLRTGRSIADRHHGAGGGRLGRGRTGGPSPRGPDLWRRTTPRGSWSAPT